MPYHTTDADGVSEINPSIQRMRAILASVGDADADHPDVWLMDDDSGWTLTYSAAGVLVLENADAGDDPPRLMRGVSATRALELWRRLASGEVRAVLHEPWVRE